MQNLRILVFSASYGGGHVRAAQAIIEAIGLKAPSAEVIHLDCEEFLGKTFNSFIKNTYLGLIRYSPKLWGKFYYGTANISHDSLFQRFLDQVGHKKLEKIVHSIQPDVIVCTYPTVAGVLAQLKVKQRISVPVVTVITDFVVHNQWIHSGIDLYLVGSQQVKKGLVAKGIDPLRIKVTGIPVSLKFEREINRAQLFAKFGLNPSYQTVLIMGGAYGVLDSITDICRYFTEGEYPVQLMVVCGKNARLFHTLSAVQETAKQPMQLYGFVDNIEELMTVADMMITKAGGLTVSEALARRLPIITFKPIPGQELENTVFLKRMGVGQAVHSLAELQQVVGELLKQPDQLTKMRQAASKAIAGHSAERAVDSVLDLMDDQYLTKIG